MKEKEYIFEFTSKMTGDNYSQKVFAISELEAREEAWRIAEFRSVMDQDNWDFKLKEVSTYNFQEDE